MHMPLKPPILLVWYKRDLRVRDHRPLSEALALGRERAIPILTIYSFEPRVIEAPDFSDFHRQFIIDSLIDLSSSLERLGIPLHIFERNISEVIKYILTHYRIE